MIKSCFRNIWNDRKRNAYIIVELFILYIILAVSGLNIIDKLTTFYEGTGAEIDNIFYASLHRKDFQNLDTKDDFLSLRDQLMELPGVEDVSLNSDAIPHSWSMSMSRIQYDSLHRNSVVIRNGDENFGNIIRLNMLAGEWYADDFQGAYKPCVIDNMLSETFFNSPEDAVGKRIKYGDEFVISGVIEKLKRNDFEVNMPTVIFPITLDSVWGTEIMVRYEQGVLPDPEAISQTVYGVFSSDDHALRYTSTLDAKRAVINQETKNMLKLIGMVTGFLVLNILLGMIGIFGYNIKRRKEEIGIRRAIGASKQYIYRYIIVESWVLTFIAMVPAAVVIAQIPLLDLFPAGLNVFMMTVGATAILVFLFVTIASIYPARQASVVEPAVALQED